MIIKILGSGCPNCQKLEANTKLAVAELGLEATIVKVTDYPSIASYQVLRTPALVVDEQVKAFGRVLTKEEIKPLLQEK